MASFVTSLSFGVIATAYNRWCFTRAFEAQTNESRRKAKLKAKLAFRLSRTHENSNKAYISIQSKFDDQVIEPDIRLFDSHHFDDHGRVSITPEEMRHPTTAFGELRRIAILEHMRKVRAANVISEWYLRLLLRRNKVQSIIRRKALVQHLSSTFLCDSDLQVMVQHREEINEYEEARENKHLLLGNTSSSSSKETEDSKKLNRGKQKLRATLAVLKSIKAAKPRRNTTAASSHMDRKEAAKGRTADTNIQLRQTMPSRLMQQTNGNDGSSFLTTIDNNETTLPLDATNVCIDPESKAYTMDDEDGYDIFFDSMMDHSLKISCERDLELGDDSGGDISNGNNFVAVLRSNFVVPLHTDGDDGVLEEDCPNASGAGYSIASVMKKKKRKGFM